ncbi:MAG: CPBP family glutamic-type intramembrane protease [Anaerolineaceae bacterium]|nr:CPBP family glutamic-type intramembrane protease [Anaerolineaceae bacterium]
MTINQILAIISEWLGVIAITLILGLNPVFRRPAVGFRYPRREGLISFFLYILILIFAFFFYSGTANPVLVSSSTPQSILFQRLFLAALCLIPFILALTVRKQPIRSTGWSRQMLRAGFELGLALAFLTIFLRGKIYSLMGGVTPAEGYALLASAGLCLAEESIFRGYLQLRLCSWMGNTVGWVVTSLLYTVWQLPRLLLNPVNLPINLALSLGQGLLLGWISQRSGNVLVPVLYRSISEWIQFIP